MSNLQQYNKCAMKLIPFLNENNVKKAFLSKMLWQISISKFIIAMAYLSIYLIAKL